MNIGIIGLGSMGQMLVKAFLKSGIAPEQVYVYNRTQAKAIVLQEQWPVTVCATIKEVCQQSELLFLCTKPHNIHEHTQEISLHLAVDKHLVSVAAGVDLRHLSSLYKGAVTRIIPTVTSQVLHGVTLLACHESVTCEQRGQLIQLLNRIGTTSEVSETILETATILTSSGPALITGLLEEFAQAATRHTPQLSLEAARRYLVETMLGTALLLSEEKLDFDDLIDQVATKGGITQEGLLVLNQRLPRSLDELFAMTQDKFSRLRQQIDEQFSR